jgi:hypothetical protein
MGWFRPLTDIELSIRGILRGFGRKVGKVAKTVFEKRIRELATGYAMLTLMPRPCCPRGTRCSSRSTSSTKPSSSSCAEVKSLAAS